MAGQKRVHVGERLAETRNLDGDIDTARSMLAGEIASLMTQLEDANTHLVWKGKTLCFFLAIDIPDIEGSQTTVVLEGRVILRGKSDSAREIHQMVSIPTLSPEYRAVYDCLCELDWDYVGAIRLGDGTTRHEVKLTGLTEGSRIVSDVVLCFHWS